MQYLSHLVADKDDALPFSRQLPHDLEQAFRLLISQRSRRFIEHEDVAPSIQGFQNLNSLLGSDCQFRDRLVQIRIQAVLFRKLQNLLLPGILIDEDPFRTGIAENDILKNRHRLYQHKMLMNHADPQLYRLRRGLDLYLLSAHIDITPGGLIQAEQHIHQRTLAGSVLSQECVNLPGTDTEIHVLIRIDTAELFRNMLHAEHF